MTSAPVTTLLRPFDQAALSMPQPGDRWVFINAAPLEHGEAALWTPLLHCEQGFRSVFLDLQNQGYTVLPAFGDLPESAGALVLASRVRQVNEANLVRAWNAVRAGGTVVYCGDKNAGAASLRKWAAQFVEVGGSLSKSHAIVFWLTKEDADWPQPALPPAESGSSQSIYQISSGMFSSNGPDKGSQLLAEQFSSRVFGQVADFGAGWGYLSAELLKRSDRVEKIHLHEADWNSLQAAKINVVGPAEFHWTDIISEPPRGPFNWIIMNPPFHSGRAAEPDLGLNFIRAAARCLPAGGRLLMVANTNLPYEATLQQVFRKVEKKAQRDGFKVLEAVK